MKTLLEYGAQSFGGCSGCSTILGAQQCGCHLGSVGLFSSLMSFDGPVARILHP